MLYFCIVKKMAFVISLLFLFRPVLPVVEYLANYDYIVEKLCENREKPKMQCNGKCHLMKELAKASEHEKPLSDKKQATAEHDVVLFFASVLPQLSFLTTHYNESASNFHYHNNYSRLSAYFLLRPPGFKVTA